MFFCSTVLECVNGDYGDYVKILSEEAKKPQWNHYLGNSEPTHNNIMKRVPLIKMSSVFEDDLKYASTPKVTIRKSYNNPPTEWTRLWLLIGRCHVQIFRDWVNIISMGVCFFFIVELISNQSSNFISDSNSSQVTNAYCMCSSYWSVFW